MTKSAEIKCVRMNGKYIVVLHVEEATNIVRSYANMCEDIQVLDTGLFIDDITYYELLVADLPHVYVATTHNLIDIIHMLKHAIEYYKRRNKFLRVPAKKLASTMTLTHAQYIVYSHVLNQVTLMSSNISPNTLAKDLEICASVLPEGMKLNMNDPIIKVLCDTCFETYHDAKHAVNLQLSTIVSSYIY